MAEHYKQENRPAVLLRQSGFLLYGLEGSRTLDLSDANRTLSQLSYEPIFKPPKTAWGRVVYNSRLFKDRMGSQLSYRPMMMTLIVYRVLGRLSSNFGEREQGTYKRPSCQKATALAAATLRESTPWDIGIFTV